jgi:glycosyltransferase involved in cell wall biosynthesis
VNLREHSQLAVVVRFFDEEMYLPTLLSSMAAQTQPPEQMLLIDDGSRDSSYEIAAAFARDYSRAQALRRPRKTHSKDRLVSAGELLAFQWGLAHLKDSWDIVVKLDADLSLNPELLQVVRQRFHSQPELGITAPYLSTIQSDGDLRREHTPVEHVRGATKFYRRLCYEEISPVRPILGWDTIDKLRARRTGWTTETFHIPNGDCVHLRPLGEYNGRLRSFRRRGRCAWGYGAHPFWVLHGSTYRMREHPFFIGGLSYLWGWLLSAARRHPRADSTLRAYTRQEHLAQLRQRLHNISLPSSP